MAAKFRGGRSKRALIALALPLAALALPLAALVPLAVPIGAAPVGVPAEIGHRLTALGAAAAATVRQTSKRQITAKKSAATRRVCTTRKVKGKPVKRCKTVRIMRAPLQVATIAAPPPSPYPATLLRVQPQPVSAPPAPLPRPMPAPPHYAEAPLSNGPIAYFWIDQADSYAQAIGNSPPDFSFACGGVNCWAWISRAGEVLIVEPARDGVLQYFFGPRETSPYLARDSYSSFAFDGRELVQVYDNQGRLYTTGLPSRARYEGQALQQRGRALFAASLRQRRWDRGTASAWSLQFGSFGYDDGWNSGWGGAWRQLPDWDRYARDHRHRHPPRQLDDEHRDRHDARRRYDDWHRRGDHGAPPPTGNPVVTPGDGSTDAVTPPPRHSRPAPLPAAPPQPQPEPQPEPRPPLAEQPLPVAEAPAPPPGDAEPPRRERPRRELEDEPGAPPILRRSDMPPPEQPVVQFQAAPEPVPPPPPDPAPASAPDPAPVPEPQWQAPPPPAPVPQYDAPAPAREQIRSESPPSGTDRP